MAYHVQCNPDTGIINAGTVNKKKDKWTNFNDVTKEALESVRDHLLFVAKKNKLEEGAAYRWDCSDGSAITLNCKVTQPGEEPVLEEKPEEATEESAE